MKNKIIKITYKSLLILLSAIFVFVGIEKILLRPEMVKTFSSLGLPNEFMMIIGFSELVLAVMLQTKYFTKIALHGLMTIMSFATFFHIMNSQYIISLIPISMMFMIITLMNFGQKVKNMG